MHSTDILPQLCFMNIIFLEWFQALLKMKSEWQTMNLNFVPYKETGVQILSSLDDVQALLDDHIVKTTTMKNSPFIKPFEKDVSHWDHHMVNEWFYSALTAIGP